MKKLYLITGATGHVGTILVSELIKRGEQIRALVLPGYGTHLPQEIDITEGDITEENSLYGTGHIIGRMMIMKTALLLNTL